MVCAEGHAPNLAQDERCCSSLECGQAVDGDVPGEAHKFNAKNLLCCVVLLVEVLLHDPPLGLAHALEHLQRRL